MESLFSLRFTILLSIILFFPYAIKTISSEKLEPYPAIILPDDSDVVNLNKETMYINVVSIYGHDSYGKLKRINVGRFLYPIPRQNFYSLAEREFGLSAKTTDEIPINFFFT
jgi:hypothetical protein